MHRPKKFKNIITGIVDIIGTSFIRTPYARIRDPDDILMHIDAYTVSLIPKFRSIWSFRIFRIDGILCVARSENPVKPIISLISKT